MSFAKRPYLDPQAEITSPMPALQRRLNAVESLNALERIGDPVLVSLTRLAAAVSGASAAAVHIFDDEFQHRVAATGAALGDHPAQDSMCRMVVESGSPIITADATDEPRLRYSSFVVTPPAVRFYASFPLKVQGDSTIGTLCAFDTDTRRLDADQIARLEDIASLVRAHLELVQIATELGREASLDGLTGATTRVMFDDQVAQALAHRRQSGAEVQLTVIDLDDFKTINDTYGHARGDAALRWVVNRLQDAVGPDSTIGRLGGDEFAVLSSRDPDDFPDMLAAIRSAGEGFEPPMSVSVGSARATSADDVASLLHRADGRMYDAKAASRERLALG